MKFGTAEHGPAICGPETINANTRTLLHADPPIGLLQAVWTEFKFDDFPQQPARVFLEAAEREVRAIASRIESLVSKGP
jgi:hypothetical protein